MSEDIVERLRETYIPRCIEGAEEIVRYRNFTAELADALHGVVSDINEYERINNLYPKLGRECWHSVAHAKELLAKIKGLNL